MSRDIYTYRTITGVCNNPIMTHWGSANIAMRRFLLPQYGDFSGDEPKGRRRSLVMSGNCELSNPGRDDRCRSDPRSPLPNARLVSYKFHPDEDHQDTRITHMLTQMGQFLDHDITLTLETEDVCCVDSLPKSDGDCFPISLPCGEPHFGGSEGCEKVMEFKRSLAFCEKTLRVREQMNGITAFIDASNVYGSSEEQSASLRSNDDDGKLKEGAEKLLPTMGDDNEHTAGDGRAMENPTLASMHTIFMREHNRIAEIIKGRKSDWDGERIFQEARRIVGAEMQNVVYGQYLTAVLGSTTMERFDLKLDVNSKYDVKTDPSIVNSFATAAYRFGHSKVQGLVEMIKVNGEKSTYRLRDNFFNATMYEERMYDLVNGLIRQPAQKQDRFLVEDLTKFLFANTMSPGSDLAARNIQRGRDHGLPGYNHWREFCGMPKACSWSRPPAEISSGSWTRLSKLYKSPSDIDLFAAGIAEEPHEGGVVGRTFNCILRKQFGALKFGDSFFFTHGQDKDVRNPFSTAQQEHLMKRNLGDIICDNTDLLKVTENVFMVGSQEVDCEGGREELDLDLLLN